MRRFTLPLIAAAMLAALLPAGARAQVPQPDGVVPAPEPVLIKLNHTPTVELFDGGAGLPYLGATAPYNAGDATGMAAALTAFHDNGVYDRELAQIGDLADKWVVGNGRHGHGRDARAHAAKATRGHKHGRGDRGRGHGKPA